jgi:hypothetical protein
MYFKVFLVLHFMLYAFQSVSLLKKNSQKSGISEECLQHAQLSRDLTHTYIQMRTSVRMVSVPAASTSRI